MVSTVSSSTIFDGNVWWLLVHLAAAEVAYIFEGRGADASALCDTAAFEEPLVARERDAIC